MVWVYFSLPTSGWIILVTELLSKPQYVSRSLPSSTELSKHLIKLAASDWFLGWAFILNGPFTSWLTVRDWRKNLRLFIWFDLRQTRFVKNQDWQLDHQSQIVSNFNIIPVSSTTKLRVKHQKYFPDSPSFPIEELPHIFFIILIWKKFNSVTTKTAHLSELSC